MSRPRILVTGFSSFPGARRNPTEALMNGLDVVRLAGRFDIELAASVLPTEYEAAAELVPALWKEIEPDAVIHFGLHGRAGMVRIERRAKNHVSPVRPDAAGYRPEWPEIDPAGPAIRRATLPVDVLTAALHARGVPARPSHDAGSYLCNFASYLSLGLAGNAITGFVHLPWPLEVPAPHAPPDRPAWAQLRLAVEETVRVVAIAARRR